MAVKRIETSQILLTILTILSPIETSTVKGTLPDVSGVLQFLRGLISTYVESVRSSGGSNGPVFRTNQETSVEKVINDKIAELLPYLQDDDEELIEKVDNSELTLEGKDETTILEFVPQKQLNKTGLRENVPVKNNNTLKVDVEKYKRIRKKIQYALKEEKVSDYTAKLVTSTLDDMMARIIENQCTWKSSFGDNKHNQERTDRSIALANQWNEQWEILKQQYSKYARDKSPSFPGATLFRFFEQFHDFLVHVTSDLYSMKGKYKLVCQIVDQKPLPQQNTGLRMSENKISEGKKKHRCEHFRICSEELRSFMLNFYNALNETAVSTLRNYASMYIRDMYNDDSQEKESLVTVLNNISDLTEYKTSKIFRRETMQFHLDKNKDAAQNIQALRNYVKNAIEITKTYIKNHLETGLKSLRARLMTTVKQDLSVNLEVDLGNLERDFKSRICTIFSVCNGRFGGRRYDRQDNLDLKNSVYVKVQLSLDDELKSKLAQPQFGFDRTKPKHTIKKIKSKRDPTRSKKKVKQRYRPTRAYRKEFDTKSSSKITNFPNVTRTTLNASHSNVTISSTTVLPAKNSSAVLI